MAVGVSINLECDYERDLRAPVSKVVKPRLRLSEEPMQENPDNETGGAVNFIRRSSSSYERCYERIQGDVS